MRLTNVAVLLLAASACEGAPTRIVAGTGDTVVVSDERPVRIPVRVLDAAGRELPDPEVRFRRISGAPVPVSPDGDVTCAQPGDAVVRATLGAATTEIVLHCRPVRELRAPMMLNLFVGDTAQPLPFQAIGADGRHVPLLAGRLSVGDSTIATLEGTRIRARAPGVTWASVRVGRHDAGMSVHVYERRTTPEGLEPGDHVAVPVRLTAGEMRRWTLAASPEPYFVMMLPERDEQAMPGVAIVGARCVPAMGPHTFFCLTREDASVIVYHRSHAAPERELRGTLTVWRQDRP